MEIGKGNVCVIKKFSSGITKGWKRIRPTLSDFE